MFQTRWIGHELKDLVVSIYKDSGQVLVDERQGPFSVTCIITRDGETKPHYEVVNDVCTANFPF